MIGPLISLILLFGLVSGPTTTFQPTLGNNYRAAMYSMVVDFSRVQQMFPEVQFRMPGLTTVSYKYFIQYGKDTVYEIIDPGNDIKSFKCYIKKLDYSNGESSLTAVMDHVQKYHTTIDTLTYSVEESIGSATDLCEETILNVRCDSVDFVLISTNRNYKILFTDTIANIRSRRLFYPDIKYLPYQIFGMGYDKNTMTLEEVFYGKPSIDSLLQLYDYEGYDQINDQDIPLIDRQITDEVIERYKALYRE